MSSHGLKVLRAVSLPLLFVLVAAVSASAQIDRKFVQGRQQNALALQSYEWKTRTEVIKDGELKKVEVSVMRYDGNGNLQKTVVSSTPEPDIPKFGLRRMVAKKRVGDFKDTLDELTALARSYSELAPEQMQRFLATATVTPEMTVQSKLVRIEGRNVLRPGDAMTIFVDALTYKQRRVEIHTTLDRKPVKVVSEFRDLPQGPTHLSRSQLTYEGNSIGVHTENFDYVRLH